MLTNLIKKEQTVFKYMRGTAGTDALITNYSSLLLKLIAQILLLSTHFATAYRQGIKRASISISLFRLAAISI